jgi:hypothetical protein
VTKYPFLLLVLAPTALMGACSQPDIHPALLPDCADCTGAVIVIGGGGDSSTFDVATFDVATSDVVTNDVTLDADDGAVDTGADE